MWEKMSHLADLEADIGGWEGPRNPFVVAPAFTSKLQRVRVYVCVSV